MKASLKNGDDNIPFPNRGLRDMYDSGKGMFIEDDGKKITLRDNMLFVDSRDFVGMQSLFDAQSYFNNKGGKKDISGNIRYTTGNGVLPITVTSYDSIEGIENGDTIAISDVSGNTSANGKWKVSNIDIANKTFDLSGTVGNGEYSGGGIFIRPADKGYPRLENNRHIINKNVMKMKLKNPIKVVRSLSLMHAIIPRDIIPFFSYLPDFLDYAVFDINTDYMLGCSTNYITMDSYIPQERSMLESRIVGYYSSPIDIYRTYTNGSFPMPNPVTPPPYVLWNPPNVDSSADQYSTIFHNQLKPYPFQTVPTYRSKLFSVQDYIGDYYNILSGYGVYDLSDWTSITYDSGNNRNLDTDLINTILARKLLLMILTPIHSYNDIDYITLVLESSVTSNTDGSNFFGYGDYQRFVPGPGLGLNYQPGTINTTDNDPTVPTRYSPVPFPYFRGNVWGPYDAPGDRFQKMGLRDVLQDLYLNHDTINLFGIPVIKPNIPTECLMEDETFGLNFKYIIEVTLGNIQQTTNPNILNAMRITPNGFGAMSQQAKGNGELILNALTNTVSILQTGNQGFYQNRFQSSGGIGPHPLGYPQDPPGYTGGNAWVNDPTLDRVTTATLSDPIASGPMNANPTPSSSDASYPGNLNNITHRTSWYDSGSNYGNFLGNIDKYINWVLNEIPDTNLIMKVHESSRSVWSQSTNSNIENCMLSVPIRLNLGTTTGTFQYFEAIESLTTNCDVFWENRFNPPLASIGNLTISLSTYGGKDIDIENMLVSRRNVRMFNFFDRIGLTGTDRSLGLSYLFDPVDPTLSLRKIRNLSFIFKVESYEYDNPGLYLDMVTEMLDNNKADNESENKEEFNVKAFNYEDY